MPILKLLLFLQDSQASLANSKTSIKSGKGRDVGTSHPPARISQRRDSAKGRASDACHRVSHHLGAETLTLRISFELLLQTGGSLETSSRRVGHAVSVFGRQKLSCPKQP